MSDILNFISKDSSISMSFELYEVMLYRAKEAERERIIKKLLYVMSQPNFRWDLWLTTEGDLRRFLDEGEK